MWGWLVSSGHAWVCMGQLEGALFCFPRTGRSSWCARNPGRRHGPRPGSRFGHVKPQTHLNMTVIRMATALVSAQSGTGVQRYRFDARCQGRGASPEAERRFEAFEQAASIRRMSGGGFWAGFGPRHFSVVSLIERCGSAAMDLLAGNRPLYTASHRSTPFSASTSSLSP